MTGELFSERSVGRSKHQTSSADLNPEAQPLIDAGIGVLFSIPTNYKLLRGQRTHHSVVTLCLVISNRIKPELSRELSSTTPKSRDKMCHESKPRLDSAGSNLNRERSDKLYCTCTEVPPRVQSCGSQPNPA